MNAKTFKKMSEIFNMPIQVSVGGGFLEDNDYKMLENLHVVANCANQHDSLVSKNDKQHQELSKQRQEIDKLKKELAYTLILARMYCESRYTRELDICIDLGDHI